MKFFDSSYIKQYATKKGFKVVDINKIEPTFEDTYKVELNAYEHRIDDFFAMAKEEKKRTIFLEEVCLDHEKFNISLYKANKYLEENYHAKTANKEEQALHVRIIEYIKFRNQRLVLHTLDREVVEIKLMFVSDDVRYEIVFQEHWYKNLLSCHRTMEEIIDSFMETNTLALDTTKKKED
ncbi:hypothetical protein [Bacillus cereus]|uniref:hypothetical protein n=1 Tax=Bacillus cereus TaxID=1396 RepID=UPI001F1E724A|nr:hypothetical protein [Bacillus cereus]BCC44636.1 hypothetical protein BCJMU01_p213 [Bacillus cereus]